jgi:bifunctional DNA-binding transcriptional regulator/antitoxin component of YhaV-PrlF toxin-antitoxin module
MSNKDLIRYEVITQEDEVTGDLLLPIPPQLMSQLGWIEGDEIEFAVDDQGRYVLKKANK